MEQIKIIKNITVGKLPTKIAINPKNNEVYVANRGDNNVSVIDGTDNTIIKNITVGNNPTEIAVDSNNNLVYVANSGDNNISVINGTNNTIINGTISMGPIDIKDGPTGIAVDSNKNLLYIINNQSHNIQVIDIQLIEESLERYNGIIHKNIPYIFTTIPLGNSPSDIAINPITKQLYITSKEENMLNIRDLIVYNNNI